ncbi:unnamed protein product [Didymodactylos carnosus]|uniref:Uncharacterized protein n=1 Tax=Didymodactylos carnosus TaxID=1234261 RepID=A0A8S2HI19_9BILA|nr:unnamed protein product [Didymodactylos carnosus]CAF3650548.1 unnamed protein product [Didymodactylos carnosus]
MKALERILLEDFERYGHKVPNNLIDLLLKSDPVIPKSKLLSSIKATDDDRKAQAKKQIIFEQIWKIMQKNLPKQYAKIFVAGAICYPPKVLQIIRNRFPSPIDETTADNCLKLNMEDFIKFIVE